MKKGMALRYVIGSMQFPQIRKPSKNTWLPAVFLRMKRLSIFSATRAAGCADVGVNIFPHCQLCKSSLQACLSMIQALFKRLELLLCGGTLRLIRSLVQ